MTPATDVENPVDDTTFAALSRHVRRRIDDAFDEASGATPKQHPRKRRKVDHAIEPGGFVIEDAGGFIPEDIEPGGFLVDEVSDGSELAIDDQDPAKNINLETEALEFRIPLSSVPHALQLLDVPADEEVLSVFRQAASGWGARSNEEGVSRKDWRAVCTVLLEQEQDNEDDLNTADIGLDEDFAPGDADDDGEDYRMSDEDEFSNVSGSDEEYLEGVASTSRKQSHKSRASRSSLPHFDNEDPRQLNSHQKHECREAFSLIFPDVPDTDLDQQKIMIKDITRVAKMLKEKLKAEDIVEMLETFSSSPDKSMSLDDFGRMMVEAKMV